MKKMLRHKEVQDRLQIGCICNIDYKDIASREKNVIFLGFAPCKWKTAYFLECRICKGSMIFKHPDGSIVADCYSYKDGIETPIVIKSYPHILPDYLFKI